MNQRSNLEILPESNKNLKNKYIRIDKKQKSRKLWRKLKVGFEKNNNLEICSLVTKGEKRH